MIEGAPSTFLGTPGWMAPELLGYSRSAMSTAPDPMLADMWALGELVFQMFTRLEPAFRDNGALSQYAKKERPFPRERLRKCSRTGLHFIMALMAPQPDDRLASPYAMEHAWIGGQQLHVQAPAHVVGGAK